MDKISFWGNPGSTYINWREVDVNNLPKEEVLCISSIGLMFVGQLIDYHDSDGIVCKYLGGYGYQITHYVPVSKINRPGE